MLIYPVLQSFAAVIRRYMTVDQASKDGRQALLTMASKPCMHEVRRAGAAGALCAILCAAGEPHAAVGPRVPLSFTLLHSQQLLPSRS